MAVRVIGCVTSDDGDVYDKLGHCVYERNLCCWCWGSISVDEREFCWKRVAVRYCRVGSGFDDSEA